mmetsp:Transcript_3119/g.3771  ORF Transcript_3119/g.3771 Transcript_3119/m.3771 type:complete len:491 (+) Transcript_3119:184-1656(+)
MSQAEFKKRLKALMNRPENQVCSDCPERQPRWASLIVPPPGSPPGSLPIGAFCCLECSGSHRRLGVHISFVRSVTLDSWKEKEVLAMENGGNQKVNAIFEANLTVSKPLASASGPVRERFIRDKYERRKYYDPTVLQQYQQSSDSSSDESEDEVPQRPVVRAPSEAAKKRAQARKQRMGTVAALPKARTDASSKKSSTVEKRRAPAAPAPAPDVDLLDFGLPPVGADPGPPPNPPSASPSPTLDMFKDMNISNSAIPTTQQSNDTGLSGSSTQQSAAQTKKKMTSDDILGLFNTPMNNNNNMGYNNSYGNNNMMMNNGMNNGMMNNGMGNNQMGMMNMNNMNMNNMQMNSQQMPSNSHNMMANNNSQNGMMNPSMINSNSSMPQNNNISFFNNGVLAPTNQPNNMVNVMPQQQQDFSMNSMAPMGGTPSNLTVMGGSGMNEPRPMYGNNQEQQKNDAFDFMGGAPVTTSSSTYSSENPQMNQFASFGSFR